MKPKRRALAAGHAYAPGGQNLAAVAGRVEGLPVHRISYPAYDREWCAFRAGQLSAFSDQVTFKARMDVSASGGYQGRLPQIPDEHFSKVEVQRRRNGDYVLLKRISRLNGELDTNVFTASFTYRSARLHLLCNVPAHKKHGVCLARRANPAVRASGEARGVSLCSLFVR